MIRKPEPAYETELRFGAAGTTQLPTPPSYEVAQKQDASHSNSDFLRNLNKATRRKPSPA